MRTIIIGRANCEEELKTRVGQGRTAVRKLRLFISNHAVSKIINDGSDVR